MKDYYKMIFWARPNENSLDMQAQQAYDILTLLSENDYFKPIYQTVRRKKDAREFNLTLKNVKDLIIKQSDKQFPDLGCGIGFFTSLDDDESGGISIRVGVSNKMFKNTMVIGMSNNFTDSNHKDFDGLATLFKELVQLFNPFYACMASRKNEDMFGGYIDKNEIPKSIYDLNYWDMSIMNKLNPICNFSSEIYEIKKIVNGYYLRLHSEMINIMNKSHIEMQKRINTSIGIQ